MAVYLYVPILAPYVVHQGGSLGLVGLVVAAYGVPQLTLRLPLAVWADRVGRQKPFVYLGLGAALASVLGMWWFPRPAAFVLWRFLAGVAASTWALFTVLYMGLFPRDRAANAIGFANLAYVLGQVSSTYLGGLLAQAVGWSAPFQAAAVLAALGLLCALGVREEPPAPSRASVPPPSPRVVWRASGALRIASGLGICSQITSFVTTFGYVPVWAVHIGLSRSDLGLLLGVSLLPTAVMTVMSGSVLAHRWPLLRVLWLAFALVAAATALTPLIPRAWWLYLTQAVLGVGRGMLSPSLTILSVSEVEPPQRGTAMATYQSLFAVGTVGGPAFAGWVVNRYGLLSAFDLAAAAGLAGALWSAWALWQTGRSAAVAPEASESR
jgi:predicted MFS family arabinose efflux permease